MSQIPKGIESKYNKNNKFAWVDNQLEKFMDKQKELENEIVDLKKERLELEMENSELRDRLIRNGDEDWLEKHDKWMELNKLTYDTPNNMELGKKVRSKVWGNEPFQGNKK